jgi:hypothetical protein
MFAHTILASKLLKAGMTKEQARFKMEGMFFTHGHFPKKKEDQVMLDALKEIAIWR